MFVILHSSEVNVIPNYSLTKHVSTVICTKEKCIQIFFNFFCIILISGFFFSKKVAFFSLPMPHSIRVSNTRQASRRLPSSLTTAVSLISNNNTLIFFTFFKLNHVSVLNFFSSLAYLVVHKPIKTQKSRNLRISCLTKTDDVLYLAAEKMTWVSSCFEVYRDV